MKCHSRKLDEGGQPASTQSINTLHTHGDSIIYHKEHKMQLWAQARHTYACEAPQVWELLQGYINPLYMDVCIQHGGIYLHMGTCT